MDPLSVTVRVIAVVGAAHKASQGLRLLKTAKGRPEGLSDLLNDVSRLELVLQGIQRTSNGSQASMPELKTVLDEAKAKLLELNCLIQYHLTEVGKNTKVDHWQ